MVFAEVKLYDLIYLKRIRGCEGLTEQVVCRQDIEPGVLYLEAWSRDCAHRRRKKGTFFLVYIQKMKLGFLDSNLSSVEDQKSCTSNTQSRTGLAGSSSLLAGRLRWKSQKLKRSLGEQLTLRRKRKHLNINFANSLWVRAKGHPVSSPHQAGYADLALSTSYKGKNSESLRWEKGA
ncbi:hypothetical protein PtB15_7B568 [Puccinia triticina]|nr:hypothetical protein PtB15_7B568 [Puccinia triticina]